MPRSTPRAVCCGLGGRRLVGCLTARPPHRGRFPTQGAPRSAATPGLWSVTPSAYSEARHDMGAFSRKEAVLGSLGGGARRPVAYLCTAFAVKRLHSAAHRLLRSSAPRGSVPIFARYAEGVSQRDTVGAARSETDTLIPAFASIGSPALAASYQIWPILCV